MFWKIWWFFYCQGSGSALTKFWGSAYDQCGSATLEDSIKKNFISQWTKHMVGNRGGEPLLLQI